MSSQAQPFVRVLITLLCLTLFSVGVSTERGGTLHPESLHRLNKWDIYTSYGNFHFINVTYPCPNKTSTNSSDLHQVQLTMDNDGSSSQKLVLARRMETLEDEDMKLFFKFKGGTFIEEYLAADKLEAQRFADAKTLRYTNAVRDKIMSLKQQLQLGSAASISNGDRLNRTQNSSQQNEQTSGSKTPIGRKKRQIEIDTSPIHRVDIDCTPAGTQSDYDANYLNLCTVCSAKRILTADHYPQYINEVFCNETQDGCLGNGHGKCIPTTFTVHLLKRKENTCRLCIKDDEALTVDEWDLYPETINVGCECLLRANSYYRQTFFKNNLSSNDGLG